MLGTTTRYWRLIDHPDCVGVEETITLLNDQSAEYTTVSCCMPDDAEEITVAVYAAARAAKSTTVDQQEVIEAAAAADRAERMEAAEAAFDALVANGVPAAAASTLTGHRP